MSSKTEKSSSSSARSTHYEILGVNPNCSSKDIRSAFLSLSKSHHPDLHPADPKKHGTYVRIMEAYSVLSKPHLRDTYDSNLKMWSHQQQTKNSVIFDTETDNIAYQPRWKDETIWHMRDKEHDKFYEDKPYYGIKGVKRVPNLWIATAAIFFMGTGALFHYVAFRKSAAFTVEQLDKRTEKLGKELSNARQRARENGNDVQLELLESKIAARDLR